MLLENDRLFYSINETFRDLLIRAAEIPIGNQEPVRLMEHWDYQPFGYHLAHRSIVVNLREIRRLSIPDCHFPVILAHELGHSRHRLLGWNPHLWTRTERHNAEFFADWYATLLVGRDAVIAQAESKVSLLGYFADDDSPSHPSWRRRLESLKGVPVCTDPRLGDEGDGVVTKKKEVG